MKLITNIEEVLDVIPVPMTTDLHVMKPFFEMAERGLNLLIGKEQFDELTSEYASKTTNENFKEAIKLAQRIVINQGYFFSIPVLSVNISPAGILINSNENTKQAFSWQVEKLELSLLDLYFNAIEDFLEYLENHHVVFKKYVESSQFKEQQRFFIKTAASFSRYFEIGNSRYIYSMLAYIMQRVEDQELELAFNTTFIEELRDADASEEIAKYLDRFINPGIALITAAKALRERIMVVRNGVATINMSGNYQSIKKDLPQSKQETDEAYDQLMASGLKYFEKGLDYVLEFPDGLPLFLESNRSRNNFKLNNRKDKGLWMN